MELHPPSPFRGLLLLLIAAMAVAQTPRTAGNSPGTDTTLLSLLDKNCTGCHSKANSSGGLVASTVEDLLAGGKHGPAIIPGNSNDSVLMQHV
ncbi:MAG TPA: c-type cytochrome domain-containing protein, partial [Bryobacteraceae bacterium]|nr:c-type cytochrome domain-containing protein [Bryobacteraceae bacterium]